MGLLPVTIFPQLSITGLGALSALGTDVASHKREISAGRIPFRALADLLGRDSPHASKPAAWIESRELLNNRKWSPASMAALHVARQALNAAGWSKAELRDCALVLGTSRGNAAGWLAPWPGRRPFRLMAASNTIHSEPATAISIEFGIAGPNHVLASGCAAGLDAVGVAMMMISCGMASRALVVAVDLPLVPALLDNYAASGLLASDFKMDPYHPGSAGFVPGEGAAAMAVESCITDNPRLLHYACNSDACDPVGISADGGRTFELVETALHLYGMPVAVSPHATGTAVQAIADPATLQRSFVAGKPSLHFLKPYLGHTIGASGLLESVILASFMQDSLLPPNPAGLTPPPGFHLPEQTLVARGPVYKLSHAMGGHNALLVISNS